MVSITFPVYVLYDLIPTGRFTQELEGGIISRDSWFIPIMIKMYEGQIHVSPKMKLKFRKIHYIKSEDLFTPWLKQNCKGTVQVQFVNLSVHTPRQVTRQIASFSERLFEVLYFAWRTLVSTMLNVLVFWPLALFLNYVSTFDSWFRTLFAEYRKLLKTRS